MNRQPIYHKQDDNYRVVYRANQKWIAQHKCSVQSSRTFDPWEDMHKPADSAEHAVMVMYDRKPLVQ